MIRQTKDIVRAKLSEFDNKYRVLSNYNELNNISNLAKMKPNKNSSNVPMSQEVQTLKKIQAQLNEIEKKSSTGNKSS